MKTPFPPFDPDGKLVGGKPRLRDISLRKILPTLLTLMAICSGLTAIRFTSEGNFELAIAAILIAGALDAMDGGVARILKSTSRFGAQMDSLADFLNFGVAPALLLYHWILFSIKPLGWIAALIYTICTGLRLARFNSMLDLEPNANWQNNFFTGVPAPAAALCVMLPVYIGIMGVSSSFLIGILVTIFTLCIAILMVSNLPTFSGKEVITRIPRHYVLPIMIIAVLLVALLFSKPWQTLTCMAIIYLVFLPVGYHSWKKMLRRDKNY